MLLTAALAFSGAAAGAGPAAPPEVRSGRVASPTQSAWLAQGHAQARIAVRLLRNASTDGLDPARYGVEDLEQRLDRLDDPARAAAFVRDLDAAMRLFLSDVHGGRITSGYGPRPDAARFDAGAYLANALNGRRLEQALDGAAPDVALYRRVKATLRQYRELAVVYPQWPRLPSVPQAGIVAGTGYEGAALLRERLQLLGDLDAEADVPTGTDHVYTEALAAAVKRFQSRHGLAEDGVLGPGTLAALSVPLTQRVAQLELTLERLRWLPPLPQGRMVVVNLPAYRLWAFDSRVDSTAPLLEMRVIVGSQKRTQTPLFIGKLRYLEFNPYWNVPRSIEVGEIIPKLERNPSYLRDNDMELVSPSGAIWPDGPADALPALRAGKLRVRQRPGDTNALGALKFAMPNPMNIYLHSTSAKELFNRTRRDLSHGCIRVEHPADLAQFVLADPQTWGADDVEAAIGSGRTRTVPLPVPVPVILFYATAVTDREGRALFAEDIYRHDAQLIQQLRAQARPDASLPK